MNPASETFICIDKSERCTQRSGRRQHLMVSLLPVGFQSLYLGQGSLQLRFSIWGRNKSTQVHLCAGDVRASQENVAR